MKVETNIEAGPGVVTGDIEIIVDEDGFMQEPEKWDEVVA